MSKVAGMMMRAAALGMLLLCAAGCALAQDVMQVYAAEGALGSGAAEQVIRALAARHPDAVWEYTQGEENLRGLVLADQAPQLAICSPEEARVWAAEGMLLPLHTRIGDQRRIQRQVLNACVMDEQLFMAPLQARHRQMAVNVGLFEKLRLGHMLNRIEYPTWYPTQMQQIMEECMLSDQIALEIWPPHAGQEAALEALVQAVFGGSFASEDGTRWQLDSREIEMGLNWLSDLLECELIAMAQSREDALARFVRGETAMFIDWSAEEAETQEDALAKSGVEIAVVPYPSALGVPVRSYELVGVCVFDSGDAARNALALQAAERLYEQAQTLLGSRAIFRDDSVWLTCLSAHEQGATVRSLFAGALESVFAGEMTAETALERAQAALDALQ
ncbi:MAG: carbohydrate ABC transporter substrate-binding protein [Clostridia bacterium]|nr:carbohydrate ABC transporter substrate-binding protein [Clostridia bacterium]